MLSTCWRECWDIAERSKTNQHWNRGSGGRIEKTCQQKIAQTAKNKLRLVLIILTHFEQKRMVCCYLISPWNTNERLVVIPPQLETTLTSQWQTHPSLKHNRKASGYPIPAWNKVEGSVVIPVQFQTNSEGQWPSHRSSYREANAAVKNWNCLHLPVCPASCVGIWICPGNRLSIPHVSSSSDS